MFPHFFFEKRAIIIILTVCGSALAAYAVVDFTQFTAQASALALLSSSQNSTSDYLKFVPPTHFNDIAVRSQCSLGGICYSTLLEKGNNRISKWDYVLVAHQPEADLSLITTVILASLILDFVSLSLLAFAIFLEVLEARGRIRKKCYRPYVLCCGKKRRWDILMIVDMVLAVVRTFFVVCGFVI